MKGKRILVVDDEAEVIEVLQEILSVRGLKVDGVPDAEGALALVRENIYDAAIIDFNLQDADGVMLHRQIRLLDEELADHTLFTSGMVQSEQNLGYFQAYGKGFLAKPFDVQEVLDSLEQLWQPVDEGFPH